MDDTGRDEPGDTRDPGRDDPDQAGWAAPSPPPPGGRAPWAGEPTTPATPTPPAGPEPSDAPPAAPDQSRQPPPPAWGQQPPPPPAWGQQPPPPPAWGQQPPPGTPPGWGTPPGEPAWGAPAPPSPPSPPSPATPGGKQRGWGWLWALIVTLVVLFGVAIAATVVAVSAFTKPADATNAYLRDLRAGQYAAAYAHLCDARRSETSLAEFRAQQQSRTTEDQIEEIDVYYSVLHGRGQTATTRYTVNRFLSRERWEVDLVKEGGQWRLCHFKQLAY